MKLNLKKASKVLVFTLLLCSAIMLSSFSKSYSKYFKEEVSLNYDLTIKQLTKSITKGTDYDYSTDPEKSSADTMVLNFWFMPTGYTDVSNETYSLSASNCTVGTLKQNPDGKITATFTCDTSAMYISNVYTTTIIIRDKIAGDITDFTYSSVVVSINTADYSYAEDPVLEPTIDGDNLKIPKSYTTNQTFNYDLKTLFYSYIADNSDYTSYSNYLTAYYENYYPLTSDNAKTQCLNGFTCTSDDNYYIYTVDKSIISYARTYSSYTKNTGYIYLDNITDIDAITKYALSLYYTDTTKYNDVLDYIDSNDDGSYEELTSLINGTTTISGLTYNSSDNKITINLKTLLLYVYPTTPFEISVTYGSTAGANIISAVNEKYPSNGIGTYINKNIDFYRLLKLSDDSSYDVIFYDQTDQYIVEVSHTSGTTTVEAKVIEINNTNNVITLENATTAISSYSTTKSWISTDTIKYDLDDGTYTVSTEGTTTTITLTIS